MELYMSGRQYSKTFEKTITKNISCKYLLYLPKDYGKEGQGWPLILFLHGAGERGDDLESLKICGLPEFLEEQEDFPFIVVSPQCPAGGWWPDDIDVLINLLDDIVSRYDVDEKKIYLTGMSMGGYGTWRLACAYPDRFAAIAPLCGGAHHGVKASELKDVPVWAFHGAKDGVVPLRESEDMVDAVKKQGGEVKFTVYPDADHDCWTATYRNKELYDWFLKHRKK
jgi:predicted peptidase